MTIKILSILILLHVCLPTLNTNTHLLENIEERAYRLFETVDAQTFNITQKVDPQNLIGAITTLEYCLGENKKSYREEREALNAFYLGIIQEMKMLLLSSIIPKDDTAESLLIAHEQHKIINRIFCAPSTIPFLQYPITKVSLGIIDALSHTPIPKAIQQTIMGSLRSDLHTAFLDNQLPPHEQFSPDDIAHLETLLASFLSFHGESWVPDPNTLYTWTCRGLKVVASVVTIGGSIYLGKQVYNTINSVNKTIDTTDQTLVKANEQIETLFTNINKTLKEVHTLLGSSEEVTTQNTNEEQEKKPRATIPELLGELAQTLKVAQEAGKDVGEYLKEDGKIDIILKDIESFLREGGKIDGILHNVRETLAHPICGGNFMTQSWAPLTSGDFTHLNLSTSSLDSDFPKDTSDGEPPIGLSTSGIIFPGQNPQTEQSGHWIWHWVPFISTQETKKNGEDEEE